VQRQIANATNVYSQMKDRPKMVKPKQGLGSDTNCKLLRGGE